MAIKLENMLTNFKPGGEETSHKLFMTASFIAAKNLIGFNSLELQFSDTFSISLMPNLMVINLETLMKKLVAFVDFKQVKFSTKSTRDKFTIV